MLVLSLESITIIGPYIVDTKMNLPSDEKLTLFILPKSKDFLIGSLFKLWRLNKYTLPSSHPATTYSFKEKQHMVRTGEDTLKLVEGGFASDFSILSVKASIFPYYYCIDWHKLSKKEFIFI